MPLPFLGAINLYWCDHCNIPIVESPECSCGHKTRRVEIAPPGDYRPAFNQSLIGFRKRLDELFGVGAGAILLPTNKLILLNRTSFVDRMDEVVVDGYVLGKLFYDLNSMKWGFKLTLEGGRRLHAANLGYRVTVDKGAVEPLSRGANVLAVGVGWADHRINPGDEVIVETPEKWVVSVGTARMTGKNMVKARKGLAVKPRQYGKKSISNTNQNVGQEWSDAVKANSDGIERYEDQAVKFIQKTRAQFQKPVALAFSGGKDSLVTLLLAMKALDEPFNIMFADTGIELPETVDYIQEIAKKYALQERLIIQTAGNRFWEDLEVFGPPARDYRWCCKTSKLAIIGDIIANYYPEGCLTFVGQRRYESAWRAAEGKISRNPWVAGQTRATPIKDWNAFMIWLYIFRENAPINPLYEIGYERIGCWLCPANRMADFENLAKFHPRLFRKWQDYLDQFQEKHKLSEIWQKLGLWRWKTLPKTIMTFLQKVGIEYTHRGAKAMVEINNAKYQIAEGVTPCVGGGVSVQAKFNMGLPIEDVANLCTILGDVRFSEDLGAIYLKLGNNITANIFSDGSFTVRGAETPRKARSMAHKLGGVIIRAIKCTGCGICQQHCSLKAISIINKHVKIDPSKCNQCGECLTHCPILI